MTLREIDYSNRTGSIHAGAQQSCVVGCVSTCVALVMGISTKRHRVTTPDRLMITAGYGMTARPGKCVIP